MDTVIIKIYGPSKFKVSDMSLFLPELIKRKYADLSQTERSSNRQYLRYFRLQPKKQDDYLPRVEVFEALTDDRKDIRYILRVTFSVPKLLYWNSLQEAGENDRERVFSALKSSLASVSIVVSDETIANATVEAVHACKNIPLPRTMHMREIINELQKIDMGKAFDVSNNDVSERKCKKGARVLNIHAGTIEWSLYDKISDAVRPKNKRSDKQRIDHERGIVERYGLQDREVFRYEYRIKKTQTTKREINALLGRKFQTPVLFKDLFRPNLMKKLVLNSWHAITERPENQLSLFGTVDKLGLLLHMFTEATKGGRKPNSMDNALISYALATAMADLGAKEFRGAVFDFWNTDHPERLNKKIKMASELMSGLPVSNNVAFIGNALEKFELITLASLEKGI